MVYDKAAYERNKVNYLAASARWASANPEAANAKTRRYRQRTLDFIRGFKNVPCADCGGRFPPVCMDFDHRDPATKYKDVSQMRSHSNEMIATEIAKCDVVCANCHRLRTERQGTT